MKKSIRFESSEVAARVAAHLYDATHNYCYLTITKFDRIAFNLVVNLEGLGLGRDYHFTTLRAAGSNVEEEEKMAANILKQVEAHMQKVRVAFEHFERCKTINPLPIHHKSRKTR